MRPTTVVFDVNETLSDLTPLADRFVEVGAPASAASLWFASLLRDAFALTAAGGRPVFAEVARAVMTWQLSTHDLDRPVDDAVEHVLSGLQGLPTHPDVAPAARALSEAGFGLVTLSNGGTAIGEALLEGAGVRDLFEHVLSVEDAGAWKPHPRSYAYAAEVLGARPEELVLVAVHPWDVDGAQRAGLQGAWVDRAGARWPGVFGDPTYTVSGLEDLAGALSRPS